MYHQANIWKKQRQQLADGKLGTTTCLIVMDFSALESSGKCKSFQDLIITTYKYDPMVPGNISSHYFHYVGEHKEKNDEHFVKLVMNEFL